MPHVTVHLVGGLGNQVHQISTAVGLRRYADVDLSLEHMGSHRSFETQPLVDAAGLSIAETRVGGLTPVSLSEIAPSDPPRHLLTFPDHAAWMGHVAAPDAFADLFESLLSDDESARVAGEPVVHIRLGDYLWPPAARKYGVLDTRYYDQALTALDARSAVVLTDDPAAAEKVHAGLFDRFPLALPGPGTTTGDLTTMCTADAFVAANSTLSLWAAWYRRQRGLSDRTVSPQALYRLDPRPEIAGLGSARPQFIHPTRLVLRHPWVVTRRIAWRGKLW